MRKKILVKVYIDGANMFYTQKKLGWFFDWGKVKSYFESKYVVKELRFYGSFKKEKKRDKQFLNALKKIGFYVISKPLKLIEDELTEKITPKANFDVEITKDILYEIFLSKNLPEGIVFLTGDSDFASLIWDLRRIFKKEVIIYSSRKTLSWELRLSASSFFYLEDIKRKIFRRNWDLTKIKNYDIKKSFSRRSR